MKSLILAALVAVAASGAQASFMTQDVTTDAAFQALGGTDTPVGELRWGNGASNGDWEAGTGFNTQSQFVNAQVAWMNDATRAFTLSFDATLSQMSLAVDGISPISYGIAANAFDFGNGLALRADGRYGDVSITDLLLNGHGLADFGADDTVEYRLIGGIDPSADWTLSGILTFFPSDVADANRGSRPSFQVKVTDVAPVPLPGALFGLVAGIGGLAGLKTRRRQIAA